MMTLYNSEAIQLKLRTLPSFFLIFLYICYCSEFISLSISWKLQCLLFGQGKRFQGALFSLWVVPRMGRNAVSGCSLFSQKWSWQMLVVIFPLSYWHSSVMFSGAFFCCCFSSLTKIAIFSLQCTFFFITYSFAPFVLSRRIWSLQ